MHGRGVMDYGIGAVYRGDWEHGLRSGWGSMYFANGDVYEGEWSEDTMHGNGIMWYWSGLLYDGEWVDGMHRGLGTMTNQLTVRSVYYIDVSFFLTVTSTGGCIRRQLARRKIKWLWCTTLREW